MIIWVIPNIIFIKKECVDLIIELTNNYWFNFTRIKPKFYEKKSMRTLLGTLKNAILLNAPSYIGELLHKVFAMLGSKSSKEIEGRK